MPWSSELPAPADSRPNKEYARTARGRRKCRRADFRHHRVRKAESRKVTETHSPARGRWNSTIVFTFTRSEPTRSPNKQKRKPFRARRGGTERRGAWPSLTCIIKVFRLRSRDQWASYGATSVVRRIHLQRNPGLGGRPTVGRVPLEHVIGVRIPASQPITSQRSKSLPRSELPVSIPLTHLRGMS